MAKTLYALCIYKTGAMKSSHAIIPSSTNIEGKIQQAYNLFEKLTEKEMVLLAERQIWKEHKKFPKEVIFKTYSDSLMSMIGKKEELNVSSFYAKPKDKLTVERKKQYIEDSIALASSDNKYDKIKLEQLKNNKEDSGLTWYYGRLYAQYINALNNLKEKENELEALKTKFEESSQQIKKYEQEKRK